MSCLRTWISCVKRLRNASSTIVERKGYIYICTANDGLQNYIQNSLTTATLYQSRLLWKQGTPSIVNIVLEAVLGLLNRSLVQCIFRSGFFYKKKKSKLIRPQAVFVRFDFSRSPLLGYPEGL